MHLRAGNRVIRVTRPIALAAAAVMLLAGCGRQPLDPSARGQFLQLAVGTPENRSRAVLWIEDHWRPGYAPMVVETLPFAGDAQVKAALVDLLERKTGQSYGDDRAAWAHWLWRKGPQPPPGYAEVKATLYGMVDPHYRRYFQSLSPAQVRLDEVQWAGLRRGDELPALHNPETVAAGAAGIDAARPVYGIVVADRARAYPRASVAQHGVISDRIAGRPVVLIHDALSGSAAAYALPKREHAPHLAASGFLFRGDTLLYDRETESLWSSLRGRPIIGPLADRDLQLTSLPAVATRWGQWRRRHPDTRLAAADPDRQTYLIDQAHYRAYVAKDRLVAMVDDPTLKADTPVLGLVRDDDALALPLGALANQRIYHARLGDERLVVVTDAHGASRAYLAGDTHIRGWQDADTLVDAEGGQWAVGEQALHDSDGGALPRVPARRARWAAWRGAFTDTRVAH